VWKERVVDDRPELRYGDCPTTEVDVLVGAPPEAGVAAGVGHPAAGSVQRRVRRRRVAGRGAGGCARRLPEKESRILDRRLSEHRVNMERTLLGIEEMAERTS